MLFGNKSGFLVLLYEDADMWTPGYPSKHFTPKNEREFAIIVCEHNRSDILIYWREKFVVVRDVDICKMYAP